MQFNSFLYHCLFSNLTGFVLAILMIICIFVLTSSNFIWLLNTYLLKIYATITFETINPYLMPIQFLGPALNAKKLHGCILLMFSGKKCSG